MGIFLGLVGLTGFVVGLITLIKPIEEIRIPTRGRAGLVLLGSFVVFFTGAAISANSDKAEPRAPEPSVVMATEIPLDQARFTEAVLRAQDAYRAAANDMAKGGVRAERRAAICKALSGWAQHGWVGRIETLSSNSDGNGVLAISIAKNVSVGTWNNALSDIGSDTLISPTSDVFKVVSRLKVGDTVAFSGNFFPDNIDCVHEKSLTLSGAMQDPNFVFRFASVTKR